MAEETILMIMTKMTEQYYSWSFSKNLLSYFSHTGLFSVCNRTGVRNTLDFYVNHIVRTTEIFQNLSKEGNL